MGLMMTSEVQPSLQGTPAQVKCLLCLAHIIKCVVPVPWKLVAQAEAGVQRLGPKSPVAGEAAWHNAVGRVAVV